MVEHLTQQQLEDYRRGQLRAAGLLAVSDHLDGCEACRRRVESAQNGDAAFFALRAEVFGAAPERAHLTEKQAAQYVDGNLNGEGLEVVSDHLTVCEQCALAVEDLRAFRDQLTPSLEREYHPASVPSPTGGWWRRALSPLTALFQGAPAPAFGAALALLLLALAGWLIWRTQRVSEPHREIVVSPAPSSQPAPTVVAQAPTPEPPPSTSDPVPSPPAPAAVVAQLRDGGGLLTLDQAGKLSGAEEFPPAYRGLLREALATRRIERSAQLEGLHRPPSTLMSPEDQRDTFSLIGPAGRVVLTDQPTFRWSLLEGATGYVVEVYDRDFKPVAASPLLTGHSWSPPRALPRGKVYAWQVKAIKDGQEITSPRPPAPQARFRVLDRARADELARARRAYPSSHLALGLLYAEAGLLEEAERELRLLRRANPDSELARRLLRQVQALRRRGE